MRGQTTWTKALAAAAAAALAFAAQGAPGNGIRLGGSEARLHPFLDLEARYDSNVTYNEANEAVGDVVIHVRPGLELKAPGDVAAVELSAAVDWAQYTGADSSELSKLYANAGLAALFNRRGSVSPRIDNSFARQLSSTSLSAASAAVISNSNVLSLTVPWKPGGGALAVAASAAWMVESFEKYQSQAPLAGSLSDLGYNQYRFGSELQWRFLPRTSGLLQAGYFTRVPNASRSTNEASGFDVLAGVSGLMTARIAATAKVGFGSTSAKAASSTGAAETKDASSVLADVGLEWLPADSVAVKLGYGRSLGIDPSVSTYVADAVRAGGKVRLLDRVALRLDGSWNRLAFEAVDGATTSFLRVEPGIDAAFGKWLTAGIGYVYSMRAADWPASAGGSPPDYAKNEAYIKVGFAY